MCTDGQQRCTPNFSETATPIRILPTGKENKPTKQNNTAKVTRGEMSEISYQGN